MFTGDWVPTKPDDLASVDALRDLLDASPFAPIRDTILSNTKPSIIFDARARDDADIAIGASKLGGLPDLTPDARWPERNGRPLFFVAQFALHDLPALGSNGAELPRSGLLSLWYDLADGPWGFDPKDAGGFQALHFDSERVERRSLPVFTPGDIDHPPDYDWEPLPAWSVAPRVALSMRSTCFDSDVIDWNRVKSHLHPAFRAVEMLENLYRPSGGHHKLLGFADQIQDEMEPECQYITNGLYCGHGFSKEDQRRASVLTPGIADWILLAQIDTESDGERDAELMWGDCGTLYYWIRRQDLATADFSRVWGILQSL